MNKYKFSMVWKGVLNKFENENKSVLLMTVTDWMTKNNINFVRQDISNQIDRQSQVPDQKRRLTLAQIASGALAVVKYTSGKSTSNAEIQRRTNICVNCPKFSTISGCGPCGFAGKITNFVNKVRSFKKANMPIPPEIKYAYCGICDCALSTMIVTKYEDYYTESNQKNLERPDVCWLKKTSPNFTHE